MGPWLGLGTRLGLGRRPWLVGTRLVEVGLLGNPISGRMVAGISRRGTCYFYQYLNGVTTTALPSPVATAQYDITNVVPPVASSAAPVEIVTTRSSQTVDTATPRTPSEDSASAVTK